MRKAIIVHSAYPYSNNMVEWSVKNFPLQSTDSEDNNLLLDKVRYCQAYAGRRRQHILKRIAERLGLQEGQYEIIDSPHSQLTDDGRFMFCAQDAMRNHRFLRYSDGNLYIFKGKGFSPWNYSAPSTVYSDRISENTGFLIDGEDFALHVEPTGELVETCELVGGGKDYNDGGEPEVYNIEKAR